jgi:hypothetical protein
MDTHTYNTHLREARQRWMTLDNRALSNKLSSLSSGKPRSMPKYDYEALLIVCADRLWKAG